MVYKLVNPDKLVIYSKDNGDRIFILPIDKNKPVKVVGNTFEISVSSEDLDEQLRQLLEDIKC